MSAQEILTPIISPNLTFGLLGGGGSSSSASATATAPSAAPSSDSAEAVTGSASDSGSGSPASALASARAIMWVVRRGEAHRESWRNEEATARTCGGGDRWDRKAWGSTTPETAVAEAAAMVRLSRANVSAAEHGTEEGGRGRRVAAAGGLGGGAIRLSLCGMGAVRLHTGPKLDRSRWSR